MEKYALIGRKLGHSFSAEYFNAKFKKEQRDAEYINIELNDISKLDRIIAQTPELKGFNVTIPYKKEILDHLTLLTPRAARIGAVNTVIVSRSDNKYLLKGDNTDAPGFLKSLRPLLPRNYKGLRALILGTGGAAMAVAYALEELGIRYSFVSRTPQHKNDIGYTDLTPDVMASHRVIVNCTPLGTFPNIDEASPIPYSLLTSRHICHDLVYNPAVTKFMQLCSEAGATVKNGYDMLLNQAKLAWRFWHEENVL